MIYDFAKAQGAWSNPPLDDIGYVSSSEILRCDKNRLRDIISQFEINRYTDRGPSKGWRNYKNLWREKLKLDSTSNKVILDFGCGLGIESLQYCKANNEIILADITEDNLKASEYVLEVFGYTPKEVILVQGEDPFLMCENKYDIFHSNGVLHHTPMLAEIMVEAEQYFKDRVKAEYRILLYNDKCWKIRTNNPLDYNIPIHLQEGFDVFVRAMDDVGGYADWYDSKKLMAKLPSYFKLNACDYVTTTKEYSIFNLGLE